MTFNPISSHSAATLFQDSALISTVDEMVDVLGNAEYQGYACILMEQRQLHPDFFELRTGLAGEMLQKYSNYRKQLGIIGDFSQVKSTALRDFIRECNRTGHVVFAPTQEAALELLYPNQS